MARSRFLSACALSMMVSAASAEVGVKDRQEIVGIAEAHSVTAAQVSPLIDEVNNASAAGLPQPPLVNKLKEGLAKGVPPARVHAVLRDLAGRMGAARDLLGAVSDQAIRARSIEVMAEALGRGATSEDVMEIGRLAKVSGIRPAPEGLAFGAKSWALLKEAGLSSREGVPLVAEAVRQGFSGPDLLTLAREVARRREDFTSGRRSIEVLRDAIRRGERPERLFPPRDAHDAAEAARRDRSRRPERPPH